MSDRKTKMADLNNHLFAQLERLANDGMNSPIRIQLSRAKGWRMPPNTVKVDRTTRWGNPWRVDGILRDIRSGDWSHLRGNTNSAAWPANFIKWGGVDLVAVQQFEAEQERIVRLTAIEMHIAFMKHFAAIDLAGCKEWLAPLRGKNLACWCELHQECHADLLLVCANV